MAEQGFDVVVIGAGPGGYVCAIKAAQLGLKTACVEMRSTLGGTCLNVGCIPSKALLVSSEKFHDAQHGFPAHGIKVSNVGLDLKAMMAHKDKVVADNTKGIEFLFKKNGVTWLQGKGVISKPGEVKVTDGAGKGTYAAKHIIIATGSDVMSLPGVAIDEKTIVSSTGALTLDKVPDKMAVVGGGVIGLEMGSVWARLGSKVTVIEYLDRILPGMDLELAKATQKMLEKQGLVFKLATKVTKAEKKSGVTLTMEPAKGGAAVSESYDVVLVAIGRRPYTDGLGLEQAGVHLDERKRVKVDSHFKTNVPGIYAIGDVIAGPMLAHKAEEEGVALAEMLAGKYGHVNYDAIPGVIYTWPEVASVGKTEEELQKAGVQYKIGKFPFSANGRARAMNDVEGFVKILADAKSDRVLGVHILGPDAGHLIAECAMAMEFGASSEDIARTCHAHPTLSEVVKEAALATFGKALHS
ncbi:MAG: dihydrolipoyl dehydrogenase [Bdellovibrionales bacterium]